MRLMLTLIAAVTLFTANAAGQTQILIEPLTADGQFHQPFTTHDVEYSFEQVFCEGVPVTPIVGEARLLQYLNGRRILCFEVNDPKTCLIVRDNDPDSNLTVEVKSMGDKSKIQLIGADGTHGEGNSVTSSGDESTITVDGNDNEIEVSGEDSTVTVYGDDNTIDVKADADGTGLDVDGDDNLIKIGKSGNGSNDGTGVTLTGKDNVVRTGDTENLDVDISGDHNAVRIGSDSNNGSYDLGPGSDNNSATDDGTNNSNSSSGGTGNKWNGGRW